MPRKLTNSIIEKRIKKLPHTKGYTLLSVYTNSKDLLLWRYIDPNHKKHYFLMTWGHFSYTGLRFKNTQLCHRDLFQEAYNAVGNKYKILCIMYNGKKQKFKIKVQHNCKKCNYSIHWSDYYDFVTRHGGCPKCYRMYQHSGDRDRRSKKELLHVVFSQIDNHDHKYIPDLSDYVNANTRLNWIEVFEDGHIKPFVMCLRGFEKGERPDNKISRNELYFKYLLKHHSKLEENIDYFYSYKTSSTHKYKRGYNFSFDFYFPNVKIENCKGLIVELNGLQHFKPVNWSSKMPKKQVKAVFHKQQIRDKRKKQYCKAHHYYLLWIPCYYKSVITGEVISDSLIQIDKRIKRYFYKVVKPLINGTYKKHKYTQLTLF